MKNPILLMLVVLIFLIATIGCNTLRGAGTDIKDAGKAVENIGK